MCGTNNMVRKPNLLDFNTAIITYPSDYNGLLNAQVILDFYKSKCLTDSTKLVIAQEDPDEEIQRTHFHLYWDDVKRKSVTTSYFDIPLEYPVIVFIHPDKTREYSVLSELESQLGWDNSEEMVAKLDEYCKENGFIDHQILKVAHPNIQVRKDYIGSKYEMLRYVVKQKLLFRTGAVNIDEELEWLLECKEELEERLQELIQEILILQHNVLTIDELIILIDELKQKRERAFRNHKTKDKKKRGRKPKQTWNEETLRFLEKLRNLVLEKQATKTEILTIIYKDKDYWNVFATNYLNYNKLINDLFKNRAPSKPKRDYNRTFWLPRKLYNKIVWLDDWVRRWTLGEKMEQRPKGLIIIGPSRTGKTSLISLLGDFSYFKNIWNVDNWESLAAFTVMDDMDAGDEGKGLSFCWYKPFFGAQDAITVTDKFKPKQDIVNGKPLIWINNYDYKETFQSKTAQDYIEKNMDIVYIDRPLFEKPVPFEWIEGHSDFIEWDPKSTWYYQHVVCKDQEKDKEKESQIQSHVNYEFVDETAKVIEEFDENEPLNQRKKRKEIENESGVSLTTTMETTAGRPVKRIRTEN